MSSYRKRTYFWIRMNKCIHRLNKFYTSDFAYLCEMWQWMWWEKFFFFFDAPFLFSADYKSLSSLLEDFAHSSDSTVYVFALIFDSRNIFIMTIDKNHLKFNNAHHENGLSVDFIGYHQGKINLNVVDAQLTTQPWKHLLKALLENAWSFYWRPCPSWREQLFEELRTCHPLSISGALSTCVE